MTFAHLIHAIVGCLLLHLYIDVRRNRLDSRLGVVIGVMGMASVFWSYGMAAGTTDNGWAAWVGIAVVAGAYCLSLKT